MATALQLAWLKSMATPAQLSMARWGVPASVTLAQAIQESAWGQSQLARRARNYFGIKAVQGEDYARFATREVVSGRSVVELAAFAVYPSAIESFDAHGRLLGTLPRYQPTIRAAKRSIFACCVQLHMDGYCTDPAYGEELLTLIGEHNLTQFDTTPQPDQPAAAKEAA